MSEELKNGILDKKYSRQQFLKMSSKSIAGLTMSAALFSLFGCTPEQVEEGVVEIMPIATGMLVANRAKCTGCQRCEVNCSLVNDGKAQPFLSRVKVRENINFGGEGVTATYATGDGIYGHWNFGPTVCRQCEDPECAKACPVKAIVAAPTTGTRTVDTKLCIGCGACTAACPWNLPTVDPETKLSTKCIACGACAAGCPTSVLKIVTWAEIEQATKNA